MNEAERITSLEKRLNDVEDILEKICKNTEVCGHREHGEGRGYGEETPIEKLKKSFD
jgi:hypothetical protein